ncbi:hypothetical protein FQZ97_876590 [compost metagenome]
MRAAGQQAHDVLGADDGEQVGLRVAVQGGKEHPAARLGQRRAGAHDGGGIRHMFQHFHAGHHVVMAGPFGRQLFDGDLAVIHLHARFQAMQACHLQGFVGQVDAGDFRAAAGHGFGQDAAAATHVQHGLARQAARALLDPFQPQGVDGVQGLELAFGIPPAARQGTELVQFGLVGIDGGAGGVVSLRGHGRVQRKALYI